MPWTVAHQAPLSITFSRHEYWTGLPFPSQGNFPPQGSNPGLPHCRQILYHLSHQFSTGNKTQFCGSKVGTRCGWVLCSGSHTHDISQLCLSRSFLTCSFKWLAESSALGMGHCRHILLLSVIQRLLHSQRPHAVLAMWPSILRARNGELLAHHFPLMLML